MKTKFDVGDEVVIKKRNEKTCDLGYEYTTDMESLAGNKATIESIRIDVDGAAYFLTGDENQWQGEWLKEAKKPCWYISGLMVGDSVWCVQLGKCKITRADVENDYLFMVESSDKHWMVFTKRGYCKAFERKD